MFELGFYGLGERTNNHDAPSHNLMPGGAFDRNESYTYFATRALSPGWPGAIFIQLTCKFVGEVLLCFSQIKLVYEEIFATATSSQLSDQ